MPISSPYSKIFIVPQSAIDENGHVNNVAYVQWMHAESVLPWNIIHPLAEWVRRAQMLPGWYANTELNTCFLLLKAKRSRSKPG